MFWQHCVYKIHKSIYQTRPFQPGIHTSGTYMVDGVLSSPLMGGERKEERKMETQNFKGQHVGREWQRQQQGLAWLGWGDYNTYTQRIIWHRLCQGKRWHRAIFYMLLACTVDLRSFTQTGAKASFFMDEGHHFLTLQSFPFLTFFSSFCAILPLPKVEQVGTACIIKALWLTAALHHSQQISRLMSSFCPSDPPATISCWESDFNTQNSEGTLCREAPIQHLQSFSFLYHLQQNALETSENREVPSLVNSCKKLRV